VLASPQEFGNTLVASSDRLRTKLLGLQAEAPNTWKAAHTLLAFNAAAAEFGHRIHIYQDQVRLPQQYWYNGALLGTASPLSLQLAFEIFGSSAGLLRREPRAGGAIRHGVAPTGDYAVHRHGLHHNDPRVTDTPPSEPESLT